MKNHLLEKLYPNLRFQNPQKPNRKKLRGFQDLEGENGKKIQT